MSHSVSIFPPGKYGDDVVSATWGPRGPIRTVKEFWNVSLALNFTGSHYLRWYSQTTNFARRFRPVVRLGFNYLSSISFISLLFHLVRFFGSFIYYVNGKTQNTGVSAENKTGPARFDVNLMRCTRTEIMVFHPSPSAKSLSRRNSLATVRRPSEAPRMGAHAPESLDASSLYMSLKSVGLRALHLP